mmetsp:Transcript_23506/g.54550  ORF Transcript_23506/g.54550 Transcript_23506/m.54550 type:complete len:793 (+) Transcript_23506:108-2486(+)
MGVAESRNDDLKSADGAEPSDGVLLSQLIQLLSRRPKHSVRLSDLSALLPSSLRKRAQDHGGLKKWIQIYSSLFQMTGEPGKELVVLAINSSGSDKILEPVRTVDSPGGSEPQQEPDPSPALEEDAPAPKQAEEAEAGGPPTEPAPAPEPDAAEPEKKPLSKSAAAKLEARLDAQMFDEEKQGHLAIQLRGLPYKATVEDVRNFLKSHVEMLNEKNPIHLVMNRDGRPSGFARVVFESEEAATAARDELNLSTMEDRYIEVFLYPDRPSKGKSRRLEEAAEKAGVTVSDAAGVTRDLVAAECRAEMSKPGNRRMLLSMLGVTLSPGARSYLKQMDQGLKFFLAHYATEFSIDGNKGCEFVVYTPLEEANGGQAGTNGFAKRDERPPGSPNAKSPGQQDMSSSNRVYDTPSNWGTPAPDPQQPANWGAPPWPGSMNDMQNGSEANPAWQGGQWGGMQSAQQQQFPGAWGNQNMGQHMGMGMNQAMHPSMNAAINQGMGQGANGFSNWTDTSGIEAAAQQGAATASAMSFGLDPQAIATAVFYGATAAAMAAAAAQQNNPQAVPGGYQGGGMGMPPGATFAANGAAQGLGMESNNANIRLRGLPYQSTEQDVLAFFAQHDVVDRIADGPKAVSLLTRSNGRRSGQAIVQMRDRSDAELAQRVLNGQWMGTRYIEVFLQDDDAQETQNVAAINAAAVTSAAGKFHQGGSDSAATMGADPSAMMANFNAQGMASWQANMWNQSQGQMMPDTSGQNGDWQALFSFLGEAQQNGAPGQPGVAPQNNTNGDSATTSAAV